MSKSKYPSQLDSSVELPTVRDNILSESINGLKSAIIQIEKTLGINPHGSTGNTVASRLNRSFDSNGNLLASAISQSGVLTGPITNSEISESAAISERKLNLNFPTNLLQDEISQLQQELDIAIDSLTNLSTKFAVHTSPYALNRHPAGAVSTAAVPSTTSAIATSDLSDGSVQSALEIIYNSHINYSGADITADNNSHLANQIFFDNANVSGTIESSNVQDAIEDLVNNESGENLTHQNTQHSNGRLRLGNLASVTDENISAILYSDLPVSFSKTLASNSDTTEITITTPISVEDLDIRPFDIVIISDDADELLEYVGQYEISSLTINSDLLESITIFGSVLADSTSGTTATIGRNIEREVNPAGLLVTAIEEPGLTSAKIAQVCNPDAVRVISTDINPMKITSTNRFFKLEIDGVSIDLDSYNSTIDRQTLDSIISKLNEQFLENASQALAYRIDYEYGSSELVIAHSLPDTVGDLHTLKIVRSSDNGLDALGFSDLEDIETVSNYGNKYFINGASYASLKTKLDSTELVYFASATTVGIGNSDIDFISLKIKEGDFLHINGGDAADNGSYLIDSVTSTTLSLNTTQLSAGFNVSSTEEVRFRIFSSATSVEDVTFDRVSASFGTILADIFANKNRDIFYNKLLEYNAVVVGTTSLIDIVDISGGDIYNKTLTLAVSENVDDATSFFVSLDGGENLEITGEDQYFWIISHSNNIKLKLYIPDSAAVISKLQLDGVLFNITVYTNEYVNAESNLLLSRALYHNFNGRFSGGMNGPRFISKLQIGNIGTKDLSNQARTEFSEIPLSELRYNGVIYGFDIENVSIDSAGFYQLDIRRGLCYINGKRIEKNTVTSITTDLSSDSIDKIYIGIDVDGNFTFNSSLPISCSTPYGESDFCIIGSIEYDGTTTDVFDLRLFIDHLDLKLLNSISVSPQKGMGHFSDVVKAVQYAKRFVEIFPNAGTPTVHLKSGRHVVELDYTYAESSLTFNENLMANLETFYNKQITSGLFLNFPINIEGEGDNTVLELINNSTFTNLTHILSMPIVIAGHGFSAATHGFAAFPGGEICIKNIKLLNSKVSCVDTNLSTSGIENDFTIKLENISFDYSDFTPVFIDATNGNRAVEIIEISDTINNKGNLNIINCSFNVCGIYSESMIRTKNINIAHCSGIDPNSESSFLLSDFYSFSTATSGSNICLIGNRHNSNLLANGSGGPEMVDGLTLGWGDRFDRDIKVGNDGYFGGSVESSENFRYSTTAAKTYTKLYYADQFFGGASGGLYSVWCGVSSPGTYQFNDLGTTAVNFPYISMDPSVDARFRVDIPVGATLTSIKLGTNTSIAIGTDITTSVYYLRKSGGALSLGAEAMGLLDSTTITTSLTPTSTHIATKTFAFDLLIENTEQFLIEINHDDISGIDLYWIELTMDITNLESAIGLQ